MKTILLPFDDTPLMEATFSKVVDLCDADANVVLLYITQLVETSEQDAETDLEVLESSMRAGRLLPGMKLSVRQARNNDPAAAIEKAAKEVGASLVILPQGGDTRVSSLAQRSVAEDIRNRGIEVAVIPANSPAG